MPQREERFSIMLDVEGAAVGRRVTVWDLACGPGAISRRLLERFPRARSVAVDFDPVLLTLGRRTLGSVQGRLRWVEADLRDPSWIGRLPRARPDAVLSTTALHWLGGPDLVRVYRQVHERMRPGGVFLNGDHIVFEPSQPGFRRLARRLSDQRRAEHTAAGAGESWRDWWARAREEPGFAAAFRERDRRFPGTDHGEEEFTLGFHVAALTAAGFRESGTVWQNGTDRVLMGIA